MPLIALGISHHTAPVEIREQVAVAEPDYFRQVKALLGVPGMEEAMIIGTCNRTEVYGLSSRPARDLLLGWFHGLRGVPQGQLDRYFYDHEGEAAVRHLVRVAGGLDSLVLGEPQILGQLKTAWQAAREAGGAGRVLDRLFQHSFAAAKSIRTSTGIGAHPVSVASTAVVLARQIFGDLSRQNVVLVGAGEMIGLCGRHLREQGITRIEIVNRSFENAEELAQELGASATTLDRLAEALSRADILISSTASPGPIVTADDVRAALRKRKHRPMFLVDIAVPRDIDPAVARLDDAYLYTIDDLQQVVDQNLEQRNRAAQSAEPEIDRSAAEFMRWLYGLRASGSLERLRSDAHAHESELVATAMRRLQAGQDATGVLEQLASTLTNRILHRPTQRLREAAENRQYEVLRAADWIFSDGEGEAPE